MPRTRFLAAAAALLLVPPATATAADPLPVGQAHGVRVTGVARGVVFHFDARAAAIYRAIAGRRVEVGCTTLSRSDKLGISEGGSSGGTYVRAPRRRAPLRSGFAGRGADYCSISLERDDDEVVSVPLTQLGATVLDLREKTALLTGVQLFAGMLGDQTTPSAYPAPARLIASRYGRLVARAGVTIVALASSEETPPARAVGYWTDGRRGAAFVTLSATGRRLYLQVGPDEELRTNVASYLLGGVG